MMRYVINCCQLNFAPTFVRLVLAPIVLAQIASSTWMGNCLSQEKPREKRPPSINLIVSKNKKPSRGNGPLKLPPDYDFDEQKRVWSEVHGLFGDAESIWADIVDHLDDQRYSLTMESNISGRSYEWTVGDICHAIVARNLTQSYYGSLKPETFDRYRTLRSPVSLGGLSDLKKWCQERKDKKLYELQIEVCELTMKALESDEWLQMTLSAGDRKACVEMMNGAAADLRRSKTATRYRGFGPEEFDPLIKPEVADPFSPLPKQP